MGEIIAAIIIAIMGGVTIVALLVTLTYLLPNRVNRTAHILEAMPGRSFIIGLVNALFFGILAAVFIQGGDFGGLLALLLMLALLGVSSIGLTGVLQVLRQRVYPQPEPSLLVVNLKTAVLLVAAGLAPLIGWFVLTPVLLIMGLGAAIIVLVQRQPKKAPTPPDPDI